MGNQMGIQRPDLEYVWIDWTSGRRERVKAKAGFWLEHLNGEDINPGSRARGSGRGRLGGKSRGWILMLSKPMVLPAFPGKMPQRELDRSLEFKGEVWAGDTLLGIRKGKHSYHETRGDHQGSE